MVRAGNDVGNDLSVLRIWDTRLEHADDCRRPIAKATQANRFADDRRILLKGGRPEAIGENDDTGSVATVVLRPDEAAEHRMKPHHVEIRAADNAGLDFPRLTQPDHGEADHGEVAERGKSFDIGAQILNLRNGKRD